MQQSQSAQAQQQQPSQAKGKVEQLKKFAFFEEKEVEEKLKTIISAKIVENEISKIEYLNGRLFLGSRAQSTIIIHEEGVPIENMTPFAVQLYNIYSVKNFLIAHGTDGNEPQSSALLKFYDTSLKDRTAMKNCRFMLQVSRDAQMKEGISFCITDDMQGIALGFKDGSVIIFQSKQDKGGFAYKDLTLKPSNLPIQQLFFSKADGHLNLFISTDDSIQCWHKCSKRITLGISGGNLFDITSRGTLIGCTKANTSIISEFDINKQLVQNDIRLEEDKYEKQLVKSHLKNYLIILSKLNEDFQLVIVDTLNQYIAHKQNFKQVQALSTSKEYIHLIYTTSRSEKKLIRLKEKENAYKIEYFFKRSFFDVAWKFAKNQNSDPALLAEISRLHGDNLYTKSDYNEAIQKYIQTIGYIEPSYIIRKFLDVGHIEYLINYLQEVHEKKQADKHHTALLLNCFVKQKQINNLDNFLKKESKYDVELFDIETAIKVCRESKKNDLALRLAEQKDQYEQYLEILLEMEKEGENVQTEKAIQYIRSKVELKQKENFILEFGQLLMKNHPEKCLELIQKIVLLSSFATELRKKNENVKPSSLQKSAIDYFGLKETDNLQISQDLMKEPDVFFHIFVAGKDEYLEKYLKFLVENIEHFQNQKALLHRLFEFYLEKYHLESRNAQTSAVQKRVQSRLTVLQDKEQTIKDLLEDKKYILKYDMNHLLVLFKMYNFEPGIIHLYQKMKLKEELLNFYIMTNQGDKIIATCLNDMNETNLWVQVESLFRNIYLFIFFGMYKALKYFTHPDRFVDSKSKEDTEKKLLQILNNIQNLNTLSPLLVLNILAKNKNIEFKIVKDFFIRKLDEDKGFIEKDKQVVDKNTKEAKEHREEYTKLKTQAKVLILNGFQLILKYLVKMVQNNQVFSQKSCSECTNDLTNPRVHFMCGHSYHDQCLHSDQVQKECEKCADEFKHILDRKEQFDQQASDSTYFLENISQKENKFDTIATYLGKGLFSQSILASKNSLPSNL